MTSNAASATTQIRPQDLADAAIMVARRRLTEAADFPADATAERLAGVLRDPNGLDFTVGFVDVLREMVSHLIIDASD